MAHRLKRTNKVRHEILIYWVEDYSYLQISTLPEEIGIAPNKKRPYKSWSIALAHIYCESSNGSAQYTVLEQTKFCRVIQEKCLSHLGYDCLYFIVDVKSLTVEQAIATTKIGCVILTHNS